MSLYSQADHLSTLSHAMFACMIPKDPDYLAIVEEFASNQEALDIAFSNAW